MDKQLFNEARTQRPLFIATITFSILGTCAVIGQALALSYVINNVFIDAQTLADVSTLLWWLFAMIMLRSLFRYVQYQTASQMAINIKANLRHRVVKQLHQLGPAYLQHQRSGAIINTITDGIDALDAWYKDYLPGVITAVIGPLIILAVVLPLDLLTFVVLLLTAPLIPVFMILIGMAAGILAERQLDAMQRMSAHFLDVIQGLTTLKLFNRSERQTSIIQRFTDTFRARTMQVLRVAFLSAFTLELLATISVAIVAVEIGLRLLNGGIPFQQAMFLLIIAPEYYLPLRNLGATFHAGKDGTAAAEVIFEILHATPPPQAAALYATPDNFDITFEAVTVNYRDEQHPALQAISFGIAAGETVALVGASGSGKSTIANLLLKFVQPDNGNILIDNNPLKNTDVTEWRQQIAWVPQHPHIFNATIADNIALGNTNASHAAIIKAAQAAQADTFINALPDGYQTIVGENGAQLSGGQAQRIALARAFLKDAPFVILDEAAANLDPITEHAINTALQHLLQNKSALLIAHRLRTVELANRVIVLNNGHIVGDDTHHKLLHNNSHYQQLFHAYTEHQQ